MPTRIDMARFAKFCKDMGFIYQSSEIYGGINGFWDYGPLGVELKRNVKEAWWQDMVRNPPPGPDGQEIRMVGLDCSIIMNPKVWVASGHVGGFSDPMVDCKTSKKRYRADQLELLTADAGGKAIYFAYPKGDEDAQKAAGKKAKKANAKPGAAVALMALPNLAAVLPVIVAPDVDEPGTLTEPRAFNLMFESHAGPIASDENKVYLRPETAQGIFANYRNVLDSSRVKLPFGIAQVGKAFRNEINPRNFTFRSREFEQMEIEFFCHPAESMKWYEYWRDLRKKWYSTLGIKSDNLKPREQGKDELAHYSIGTTDIEYLFPFSEEPQELEGVAHRGAFDLSAHAAPPPKGSGMGDKLMYFDEDRWNADAGTRTTNSFKEWMKTNPPPAEVEKYQFTPHVIEPSAGADRFTLAVLCEAYTEDKVPDAKGNEETRVVMRFHPRLAPIKAAVFPLVNKDGMPEKAMKLYRELKPHFNVFFDDKGAVGRRYRRQDEAGTPFCITIDGQTMQDDTVTIRDRDTLKQERVPMAQVRAAIEKAILPA
ncbi:MAG: glycine--tRNA ligase [Gemmataceae bacterium]|nr:glycine--tRNA ligase [Gemmataceae bacterium]